jgi:hypothetical protein
MLFAGVGYVQWPHVHVRVRYRFRSKFPYQTDVECDAKKNFNLFNYKSFLPFWLYITSIVITILLLFYKILLTLTMDAENTLFTQRIFIRYRMFENLRYDPKKYQKMLYIIRQNLRCLYKYKFVQQ